MKTLITVLAVWMVGCGGAPDASDLVGQPTGTPAAGTGGSGGTAGTATGGAAGTAGASGTGGGTTTTGGAGGAGNAAGTGGTGGTFTYDAGTGGTAGQPTTCLQTTGPVSSAPDASCPNYLWDGQPLVGCCMLNPNDNTGQGHHACGFTYAGTCYVAPPCNDALCPNTGAGTPCCRTPLACGTDTGSGCQ